MVRPGAESRMGAGSLETGTLLMLGSILVLFPDSRIPREMIVEIQESKQPRHFPFCMRTSPVVALFDTEEEGRACLLQLGEKPREYDPRWKTETCAVLSRIGTEHPQIVLHTKGQFAIRFMLPVWQQILMSIKRRRRL